uniref:Uncharacterized protein n=1 Tax=Haemonchus contortus TaxID=6289 RepID=W6NDY3_HAECO
MAGGVKGKNCRSVRMRYVYELVYRILRSARAAVKHEYEAFRLFLLPATRCGKEYEEGSIFLNSSVVRRSEWGSKADAVLNDTGPNLALEISATWINRSTRIGLGERTGLLGQQRSDWGSKLNDVMIDTGPFRAFRILRHIGVKTDGDPNRDQRSILSPVKRFYPFPLRSENGAAKPNREAFLRSKRGSNVESVLIETGPILVRFRLLS